MGMSLRREAIKLVGLVTSPAQNVPDTWPGILSGKSVVKFIT